MVEKKIKKQEETRLRILLKEIYGDILSIIDIYTSEGPF